MNDAAKIIVRQHQTENKILIFLHGISIYIIGYIMMWDVGKTYCDL